MRPINDIDAQLLLATLIASKRRPAELVEMAAADVLGCPVTSGNLWAESFRRFATHDLMVAVDGRYTPRRRPWRWARSCPRRRIPPSGCFWCASACRNTRRPRRPRRSP
jgi:hypothetical protein